MPSKAAPPVTVIVAEGPTANTAIVYRSTRRDGHDVILEAITLVKSKSGWKIESVAR